MRPVQKGGWWVESERGHVDPQQVFHVNGRRCHPVEVETKTRKTNGVSVPFPEGDFRIKTL